MDLEMFQNSPTGELVDIAGTVGGRTWTHKAFLPAALGDAEPQLDGATYRAVAEARAALASLDATASRLPNPGLFRHSALRLEAQSTAALEGTYEPLARVLATETGEHADASMREVLNYVTVAETAFAWHAEGHPLTVTGLAQLQAELLRGTASERPHTGVRDVQVVIGRRDDASPGEPPITGARFVPPPPGPDLEARFADLLSWANRDHRGRIDPVIGSAMAHYTFESLHPFHDGNGRVGRLLIVLTLLKWGVLTEPTLTVSPWFETRRHRYYDALLGVSATGDWSTWVTFFADGLAHSAEQTRRRMVALVDVHSELQELVHQSSLRSANAVKLLDLAIASPSFNINDVTAFLGVRSPGAKKLVDNLTEIGVLEPVDDRSYARRYHSPAVLEVLLHQDE